MKSYLNKSEREDYCVIALAAGKIEHMLKDWEKNLTPDEHKALCMAKTYIYKFMDNIKDRMDESFVRQLIRDIKSSEILVLPTLDAQREFSKRKLNNEFAQVNKDTILNLAEHALIGCEECTKCDWNKCDLRETFMGLNIEPYSPEAKGCQYKVTYDKEAI